MTRCLNIQVICTSFLNFPAQHYGSSCRSADSNRSFIIHGRGRWLKRNPAEIRTTWTTWNGTPGKDGWFLIFLILYQPATQYSCIIVQNTQFAPRYLEQSTSAEIWTRIFYWVGGVCDEPLRKKTVAQAVNPRTDVPSGVGILLRQHTTLEISPLITILTTNWLQLDVVTRNRLIRSWSVWSSCDLSVWSCVWCAKNRMTATWYTCCIIKIS